MEEGNKPDTLVLMVNTLNALGRQPSKNKDYSITVNYRGEYFHMEFDGDFAIIWNPFWEEIDADDPDMAKIRESVKGIIGLQHRHVIMLHPACPDNEPFVKAVLDSFFDAKEAVRNRYQQINAQQMEDKKNRRPVGFTTTQSTTD